MTTTSVGESATTTATESGTDSETTLTSIGDGDGDPTDQSNVSISFYACSDPYDWSPSECDPFSQDCPEGEKCVGYASTGGTFDGNKCVPITGNGQTDDPCVYAGVVESTDDCDLDNFCFNVVDVDGMLQGTCTPFCTGTPDDPICDDGLTCFYPGTYDGSLNLCLAICDPLLQDCAPEQACIWGDNAFMCLQTLPAAGANGEACDDAYFGCEPGTICIDASVLPDCGSTTCCTEYCDTSDLNFVCADPNYACVPFFAMGQAPPDYADVGVCAVQP